MPIHKTIDRDLRAHDADFQRIYAEMQAHRQRLYDDYVDAKRRADTLETQLARADRALHLVVQRD